MAVPRMPRFFSGAGKPQTRIDQTAERGIKRHMKKLVLALTLTAFAIVASQADEAKPAKNMKDSSCCSKTATQVKATKDKAECSGCCKEKQQVKLMSPKAAAEMGR